MAEAAEPQQTAGQAINVGNIQSLLQTQPQKYADVAKTYLGKLRYAGRRSSAQPRRPDNDLFFANSTSPVSSQSTVYNARSMLRALDINKERTHVVLAGRKILKTIRIDGTSCTEDFDLRNAAVKHASSHSPLHSGENVSSAQRETFDIEDVAWSNGIYSNYIATAASNGKIMLYDMSRPDVEVARLHEHYRQVHKVDFNPIEGRFLLSGSQDGTVRLWDLRVFSQNMMICSSSTFPGRSDGVRHVKWNPVDRWIFALGTDNGTIQRWDTRKARSPIVTVAAHTSVCNSLDWHPDGKHLVSTGKDREVKVWDMGPEGPRKRKPAYQLRTPRDVQNVRWRPACVSSDPQDNNSVLKQCTHLATSYRHTPIVHVWDLRRPYMPFREINHKQNTGTTDMLWRSKDLLWTVGPEGDFTQTDIHYAPKVLDRRCLQTVASSATGDIAFFTSPQLSQSRQGSTIRTEGLEGRGISREEKNNRSPGDDSFEEQFLTTAYRKWHQRTPSTSKSVRLLAVLPASSDEPREKRVAELDSTMREYEGFRPHQFCQRGVLPGSMPSSVLIYLAWKYKSQPFGQPAGVEPRRGPSLSSLVDVKKIFERNAAHAQYASLFREAQTWRILGATLERELNTRAEVNRKLRLTNPHDSESPLWNTRSPSSYKSLKDQVQNLKASESSSNTPTPLARPVADATPRGIQGRPTIVSELETELQLPPSLMHQPYNGTGVNQGQGSAIVESKDKKGEDSWSNTTTQQSEKLALINQWKAQPKTPFSFDQHLETSKSLNARSELHRHTSEEEDLIFPSGSSGSRNSLSEEDSFASRALDQNVEHARREPSLQNSTNFLSEVSDESSLSDQDEIREDRSVLGSSASASTTSYNRDYAQPSQDFDGTDNNFTEESTSNDSEHITPVRAQAESENNSENGTHHHSANIMSTGMSRTGSDSLLHKVSSIEASLKPCVVPNTSSGEVHRSIDDARVNSAPAHLETNTDGERNSEELTVLDYLNPLPFTSKDSGLAFTALEMLQRLLSWYTDHSDFQMASHLLLLSLPILAPTGFRTQNQHVSSISEVLNTSYSEHFINAISMTPKYAAEIISTHLVPLQAMQLSPAWVESILSSYHEQLLSLNMSTPAVVLRRLAYPAFPTVYEQGLQNVQIGLVCLACRSPINNPRNKMRCETCKGQQAECPICCSLESPYDMPARKRGGKLKNQNPEMLLVGSRDREPQAANDAESQPQAYPGTPLWASCLLCGHATHTACAFKWFADSHAHGACPTQGCVCDCMIGGYREARLAGVELLERLGNHRKSFRLDDAAVAVGESKTLNRVKGVLRPRGATGETEREDKGEDVKRVRLQLSGST